LDIIFFHQKCLFLWKIIDNMQHKKQHRTYKYTKSRE
jgi:hypothetical protein